MAVDINGELHPVRVTANHPARAGDERWTCERCGYRPRAEEDLADHLNEIQAEMSR